MYQLSGKMVLKKSFPSNSEWLLKNVSLPCVAANDKAGSLFNLLRWVNIRTIKENFNPPHQYLYPNFAPDKQ